MSGARSCKPTQSLSNDSMRYISRTIIDCRPYRSSHVGCRFGRSGSSGFVVGFHRLRLSDREPVLKDRRNPDRCRYRYICRPVGFLTVNGCNPASSSRSSEKCLHYAYLTLGMEALYEIRITKLDI